MSESIKLFIVEGEVKEKRIIEELTRCFFKGKNEAKIVSVSTAQNIYMLYDKLKEDRFDTDVVELLREMLPTVKETLEGIERQRISDVFLFFDYDLQANNIGGQGLYDSNKDVVDEMISVFDDSTQNGKLYISYPMSEAVYDYRSGYCQSFSACFCKDTKIESYKRDSGNRNPNASRHFGKKEWNEAMNTFVLRAQCLFEIDKMGFSDYRKNINTMSIFDKQNDVGKEYNAIFVLSAFPEFLLDYFGKVFWNAMIKQKKQQYDYCVKRRD